MYSLVAYNYANNCKVVNGKFLRFKKESTACLVIVLINSSLDCERQNDSQHSSKKQH